MALGQGKTWAFAHVFFSPVQVTTVCELDNELSEEETMINNEQLIDLVAPVVAEHGADLYDIEQVSGIVRVLIDHPDGVDTDILAKVTRSLSNLLDEVDPLPDRYSLEVSSPGVERSLRIQRHFIAAIGKRIKIKTVSGTVGERRVEGALISADDQGFKVETGEDQRHFAYDEVESAKTVFDWGTGGKKATNKPEAPKTRKVVKA